MATFVGRSGNHILFSDDSGEQGVVVDARYGIVVASGALKDVEVSHVWDTGEFTETDERAAVMALSAPLPPVVASTGRLYTVPRGVRNEARRALDWHKTYGRGATPAGLATATLLASGGQVDFNRLQNINQYFSRRHHVRNLEDFDTITEYGPADERIEWGTRGGDSARKWASSIVGREAPEDTAENDILTFEDIVEENPDASVEFLARVRLDGSGLDRLYKLDLDGTVYVWDGDVWETLGLSDQSIWSLDSELDKGEPVGDVTHVMIDPESAVVLSAMLHDNPFVPVSVEDIAPEEAELVRDAIDDEDWSEVDSVITAAGELDDGIYTEEERSQNASKQVRDRSGKFAKVGTRVMIAGDQNTIGNITKVDPSNGSVDVELADGRTVTVPGRSVEAAPVQLTNPAIPGRENEVPATKLDTTGILAEPRTPVNRVGAQIAGTLPQMTPEDLHSLISDWPAWVKSQRDAFKPAGKDSPVQVDSTGTAKDPYSHPLIQRWLKRMNRPTTSDVRTTGFAVTAAGELAPEVPVVEPVAESKPLDPDTADVQCVYLAIVAPDDPRAVLELVSLVPASDSSTAPMTYVREDGTWKREPRILSDLNSATPPPVVPLDSDTLSEVLSQVDDPDAQAVEQEPVTDAPVAEETPVPAVAASAGLDHELMVLFGPRKALIAAGGLDRNRGGAEKLRHYWTRGEGALKIRWGTPGDWTRCVRQLSKHMGARAKGYCALRHKEVTGLWTGDKKHRQIFSNYGGTARYSDEQIVDTDAVIASALLRAKAKDAHSRILASAIPQVKGARFVIPLVIPEDVESGDGRVVERGALTIRDLPLPLMWQEQTGEGHGGSYIVGRIDYMERVERGIGNAYGFFDTGIIAAEAERLVREDFLRGVSADLDQFEAAEEDVPNSADDLADPVTVEKKRLRIKAARVMGATLVAKPAFQECPIFLKEEENPQEEIVSLDTTETEAVDALEASALIACGYVAGAIPVTPPKEWFENPRLNQPTPLTLTDDGRVFGHVAAWHTDHIGMTFGTRAPKSRSGYKYFHTGVLRTDDGDVPVGQLTLAGGHASLSASAEEAVKHYDDTASAIADVHAGEDQHGIWVSGAIRPGTTPEQIRAFRASAPSGDWRPIQGRLEMVAVCQVNVPGFPIPRARVASGGHVTGLVAAGAPELARMAGDSTIELASRVQRLELEHFARTELALRASAAQEKVAAVKAAREGELSAKAAEIRDRFSVLAGRPTTESLLASVETLRARVAAARTDNDKQQREELEKIAKDVAPEIVEGTPEADSPKGSTEVEGARYTPDTQPRDEAGKFREILARLRDNLGVNGNQKVLDKIQAVENLDNTGDYKQASESAADLINTIERIDTGALNPEALNNIRSATTDLGKVIANLPLPFENQAEKVRFSDLPPALRELVKSFVTKVEAKIEGTEGREATAPLRSLMSGADLYSQSEISSELNKMLRLLT